MGVAEAGKRILWDFVKFLSLSLSSLLFPPTKRPLALQELLSCCLFMAAKFSVDLPMVLAFLKTGFGEDWKSWFL